MDTYRVKFPECFQANLTEAMNIRGISQSKLGLLAGTTQSQISKYQAGGAFPTVDLALRMAQVLNVSVAWLCYDVGPADNTEPIEQYLARLILHVQPDLGLLLEAFLRSDTKERNAFVHNIHQKVPDKSLHTLKDLCNALAVSSTLKGSQQVRSLIGGTPPVMDSRAVAEKLFKPMPGQRAGEDAGQYPSASSPPSGTPPGEPAPHSSSRVPGSVPALSDGVLIPGKENVVVPVIVVPTLPSSPEGNRPTSSGRPSKVRGQSGSGRGVRK